MDVSNLYSSQADSDNEQPDLIQETQKIQIKLSGDMCLDDSDKNFIMIWSKALGPESEDLIVCWQVTDAAAGETKNMVSEWEHFVVLTADGKPLGTARDYLLTK